MCNLVGDEFFLRYDFFDHRLINVDDANCMHYGVSAGFAQLSLTGLPSIREEPHSGAEQKRNTRVQDHFSLALLKLHIFARHNNIAR